MQITPEIYEKNIPSCCQFRTLKEHEDDLLLCWSLVKSIEDDKPMNCSNCEFNTTK